MSQDKLVKKDDVIAGYFFFSVIAVLILLVSNLLSCTTGTDSGRTKERERWEKLLIEKGVGTYKTRPIGNYTEFEFK